MKELMLCLTGIGIMVLSFILIELEDQTKLTKEQNEILTTYCKALPECKKEMEK